jgi:hypothetical protein
MTWRMSPSRLGIATSFGMLVARDVFDDLALAMIMKPPYQLTCRFLDTSVCTIGNRKQSLEYPLTKHVRPTQPDFFLVFSGTANVP